MGELLQEKAASNIHENRQIDQLEQIPSPDLANEEEEYETEIGPKSKYWQGKHFLVDLDRWVASEYFPKSVKIEEGVFGSVAAARIDPATVQSHNNNTTFTFNVILTLRGENGNETEVIVSAEVTGLRAFEGIYTSNARDFLESSLVFKSLEYRSKESGNVIYKVSFSEANSALEEQPSPILDEIAIPLPNSPLDSLLQGLSLPNAPLIDQSEQESNERILHPRSRQISRHQDETGTRNTRNSSSPTNIYTRNGYARNSAGNGTNNQEGQLSESKNNKDIGFNL